MIDMAPPQFHNRPHEAERKARGADADMERA